MTSLIPMIGKKFNRLTVKSRSNFARYKRGWSVKDSVEMKGE